MTCPAGCRRGRPVSPLPSQAPARRLPRWWIASQAQVSEPEDLSSRRRLAVDVIAALLAGLLLTGCSSSPRADPGDSPRSATGATVAAGSASAGATADGFDAGTPSGVAAQVVLPGAGAPDSRSPDVAPNAAAVQARLAPPLSAAALGPRVGAAVVDLGTASTVFEQAASAAFVPASTMKILTSIAVLAARGPDHRFDTKVLTGQAPGDLVVVGGGDPMLSARGGSSDRTPLGLLVTQTVRAVRAGGLTVRRISVEDSLFTGPPVDPDWHRPFPAMGIVGPVSALSLDGGRVDPSRDVRSDDPAVAAGAEFAQRLRRAGVAVALGAQRVVPPLGAAAEPSQTHEATPGPTPGPTPGTASGWTPGLVLAQATSVPLSRIVEHVLETSDNDAAETLARHAALGTGRAGSSAAASDAVLSLLVGLGVDISGIVVADGSGLSSRNRLSPRALIGVLAAAASDDHPAGRPVLSGLAVAGFSGTLADRFPRRAATRPGLGVVRAKTGTLTGVSALAGTVVTGDGTMFAFAFLADRVRGTEDARAALDRAAAALARCGCSRTVAR